MNRNCIQVCVAQTIIQVNTMTFKLHYLSISYYTYEALMKIHYVVYVHVLNVITTARSEGKLILYPDFDFNIVK